MPENKEPTEYAIKQVGDRYYPVIVDREAGGHYEIRNPRDITESCGLGISF